MSDEEKVRCCMSYLVYGIGSTDSDCAHSNGHHYCVLNDEHEGAHKTTIRFEANTNTSPFRYNVVSVVEFN